MTLLKDPSSTTMNSLDNSEDPFNYVPLGAAAKRRKKRRDSPPKHLPPRKPKKSSNRPPKSKSKEGKSHRCPACGMPWNCLKSFESPEIHKGFCPVGMTCQADRERVPPCPKGRLCRSELALHYELRRHEHINWNEDPPPESSLAISPPFKSPPITPALPPKITPRRKKKKLFSESDAPLLKEPQDKNIFSSNHIESPPGVEARSPSRLKDPLSQVPLHKGAESLNDIGTLLNVDPSLNTTSKDSIPLNLHLSTSEDVPPSPCNVNGHLIPSNSSTEGRTYEDLFHSTPLTKPPPPPTISESITPPIDQQEEDDLNDSFLNASIYKAFIEEEIQRNMEKSGHSMKVQIDPEDETQSFPSENNECLRSGVHIAAKKNDDGIQVSLKVTDPHLQLQAIQMRIPSLNGKADGDLKRKKQATINDFFGGSHKPQPPPPAVNKENDHSSRTYQCPAYKRISHTSFVVDAFNYGYIPGVSIYFLSHFHRDHYIGLSRGFSKPIVCSRITASLLMMQLNISEAYIRIFDLNMERTVDGSGVTVTLLEANHCPGAVMFLFKFPDGSATLHTGDFRAHPSMEEYPALWDVGVKRLHLDTTYCSPEHDFPAQDLVIQRTVSIVKDRLQMDPKILILVGTYTIGKERIFIAIAEELNRRIFPMAAMKSRILGALEDDVLLRRLVSDRKRPESSYIHVATVKDARSPDFLDKYRRKFKVSSILSIVPTGWTKESSSFKIKERGYGIYCLEVPYSEHSSYSELKRFVQFMNLSSAECVVPTVGVGSFASRNKLKKIFTSWIEKDNFPPMRRRGGNC